MAARRQFDWDEAIRLYDGGRGLSMEEIADQFGVTKPSVWRVLTRHQKGLIGPAGPNGIAAQVPAHMPETAEEMLELAIPELWTQFKATKGIAKMKAFDAIVATAKRERADGDVKKEPEPLIADVVSGVASLSAERKLEILSAERERLAVEAAAVDGALAGLGVAA